MNLTADMDVTARGSVAERTQPKPAKLAAPIAVVIPAYNEAATVADTIRSIQSQSLQPAEIIVVDDCSSDGTGKVARDCGATVLRTPANTGSKAGAQNHALHRVNTPWVMTIDADTVSTRLGELARNEDLSRYIL